MIGVSPAFFFSRYSTHFTPDDYIDGLQALSALGFTGYQPEIYYAETLGQWMVQGRRVNRQADLLGLHATQFVAHFLLFATADAKAIYSDCGMREMEQVLQMLEQFPECKTVTLPLSPCSLSSKDCLSKEAYEQLWNAYIGKILAFGAMVEASDRHLALEIVPGSLMGTTEGFLRFCNDIGSTDIGYNFDTGHAWSCKECILSIPAKLAGRIRGTHLKDNFGTENHALALGRGSIPWKELLETLSSTGYHGSLDLEIVCPRPDEVLATYLSAKEFLETTATYQQHRRQQ